MVYFTLIAHCKVEKTIVLIINKSNLSVKLIDVNLYNNTVIILLVCCSSFISLEQKKEECFCDPLCCEADNVLTIVLIFFHI